MKRVVKGLMVFSVGALPIFTSCIKERCAGCGAAPQYDSAGLMVSFSYNYDYVSGFTKSTGSMDEGIRASVFAFSSGDNPERYPSFPGTPVVAVSDNFGNLTLRKGEYLFVPEGFYDFYSISENRAGELGIKIASGVSSPLVNGTDYLWASFKNSYIAVNTNICFIFRHCSAQIKIDFTEGDGVSDLHLLRVALAPAAKGGRMILSSGIISSADRVEDVFQEMLLSGSSAQFTMLPLKSGTEIPVEVDLRAKFDGVNPEFRKCKVLIPSPAGGFRGGSSYNFKAVVYAGGLELGEAVVLDWNIESTVNINMTD